MTSLIYKLIRWYLKRQLDRALEDLNGPSVDRLVNAIDMIEGEISAPK